MSKISILSTLAALASLSPNAAEDPDVEVDDGEDTDDGATADEIPELGEDEADALSLIAEGWEAVEAAIQGVKDGEVDGREAAGMLREGADFIKTAAAHPFVGERLGTSVVLGARAVAAACYQLAGDLERLHHAGEQARANAAESGGES